MCNNTFNIKVVEGNEFPIILRLQALSYSAVPPIAEPIDYTKLTDCVFKVGGVQYNIEITEDGVRAIMPATLALGDYNVEFTAKYEDSDIRAAYLRAITIVKWNVQSNAGECLLGSPVVLPAAIVIGGTLTDAELEELKEEMREKNAQLAQAIEDAEAAKAEWERKAAELDDVAQQSTLTQGVQDIRSDISHIDIDTSDLAKEATSQEILQNTQAIGAIGGELESGKAAIASAIEQRGGQASAEQSLGELAQGVLNIPNILTGQSRMIPGVTQLNLADFCLMTSRAESIKDVFIDLYSEIESGINSSYPMEGCVNLKTVTLPYYNTITPRFVVYCTNLERFYAPYMQLTNNVSSFFYNLQKLKYINLLRTPYFGASQTFYGCINLIDIVTGAGFVTSVTLVQYNPTNCYLTNSSSLCFDTDQEEYGQIFSTNFDKWKWCIINHFAANLQDRTGLTAYTITFGSSALSHFDAEMIAAFTDKNWTLA